MSGEKSELEQQQSDLDEVCACCGVAAVDDVKLKICDGGCNLVKYCSGKCQENHREQHEKECTERKTELHDKELFTQPHSSNIGECPICVLPLSIEKSKSTFMGCCCKLICNGCNYANMKRENEQGLPHRCPFCRNPAPKEKNVVVKQMMKRVKKNDPVAMAQMGRKRRNEGDYGKALEYFNKAAELGDAEAHACLANLYSEGDGVEKDDEKAVYHMEQGAIGGHHHARYLLACYEDENGNFERAAKHLIINANLGCNESLQWIKDLFIQGIVSKDEYAAALRGYQAAVNETKSPERDEGDAFTAFREALEAAQRS